MRTRSSLARRHACAIVSFLALVASGCATTQAMRRGYEINTVDITCEEANRYVQDALGDMNMTITEFEKARPGQPGHADAERDDMGGRVDIRCDAEGVHIDPNQHGFSSGREFERGLFLSVTGRADLVVEREGRYATGVLHKRKASGAAKDMASDVQPGGGERAESDARSGLSGGVEVQVELVRGFATVLDFEANVAAAGILPVKITVKNGTNRSYDFDPRDVVLRPEGTRERIAAMSARETVEMLQASNLEVVGRGGAQGGATSSETAPSELGDVEAASRIIPEREIKAARLGPGASASGYLYYRAGAYDRARLTMIDTATGETEGFIVEF